MKTILRKQALGHFFYLIFKTFGFASSAIGIKIFNNPFSIPAPASVKLYFEDIL